MTHAEMEVYRDVFPVFVTGHHCGSAPTTIAVTVSHVFPVFVTGHHCGWRDDATKVTLRGVFPVFVTGHHCGGQGPSHGAW